MNVVDDYATWAGSNNMPWFEKAIREFLVTDPENKQADSGMVAGDILAPPGYNGYIYMNLHLLTGEFMSWLPYTKERVEGHGAFRGILKLIPVATHKVLMSRDDTDKNKNSEHAAVFAGLDYMLHELDADINNTPLYQHVDFQSWRADENITDPEVKLFLINLRLVRLDALFMISSSLRELLEQLNRINTEIEQLGELKGILSRLAHMTLDKTNFLFRKTLLAEQRLMPTIGSNAEEWLYEQLYKPEKYRLLFLQPQINHARSHYTNRIAYTPWFEAVWRKFITGEEKLLLDEYHTIITGIRYKDDPKEAYSMLEKTRETIFSLISSKNISADTFDNLALQTLWTYLHSAMTGVILKDADNLELKEGVKNARIKVKEIGEKKKAGNWPKSRPSFYDYYYLGTYYDKYCSRNADKMSSDDLLVICDSWGEAISDWKKEIALCQQKNYHPFFLPFEESLFSVVYGSSVHTGTNAPPLYAENNPVKIGDVEIKIFIASSYILPLNLEELKREIAINQASLVKYQHQLVTKTKEEINNISRNAETEAKNAAKEVAKVEAKEEAEKVAFKTARENSKDSELRAIQVIAVFVSVITFAGSAVAAGKQEMSLPAYVLFLGVIGFALTVFVGMLLFHLKRLNGKENNTLDKFVDDRNIKLDKYLKNLSNAVKIAGIEVKEEQPAYDNEKQSDSDHKKEKWWWDYKLLLLCMGVYIVLIFIGAWWFDGHPSKNNSSRPMQDGLHIRGNVTMTPATAEKPPTGKDIVPPEKDTTAKKPTPPTGKPKAGTD